MRCLLFLLPVLLLMGETPPAAQRKTATAKTPSAKAAPPAAAPMVRNFKEAGSPNAPLTLEVYTDYECPSCRNLYLQTMPALMAEYVKTGKARFIHRDFRLPQHRFGPLATRFANAAGRIGKYDAVVDQIFRTQPEWSQNGNVEAQVAKVLSPAEMARVKEMVKNDPTLD